MTKQELRKEMRQRAEEFSTEMELKEAVAIWQQVENLKEFQQAKRILIYMSIKGEVPARDFIAKWAEKKEFILPKVNGDELDLLKYDPSTIKAGYLGIEEPEIGTSTISPASLDLAIIPGVAFDRQGNRLGHGKGFYDRLLPKMKCPTIGVCFSYRMVESVPTEKQDIPLSLILSANP